MFAWDQPLHCRKHSIHFIQLLSKFPDFESSRILRHLELMEERHSSVLGLFCGLRGETKQKLGTGLLARSLGNPTQLKPVPAALGRQSEKAPSIEILVWRVC